MKKIMAFVLLLCVMLSFAAPVQGEGVNEEIFGIWLNTSVDGYPDFMESLILYPDGLAIRTIGVKSLHVCLPLTFSWTGSGDRVKVEDNYEFILKDGFLQTERNHPGRWERYERQEWLPDLSSRMEIETLESYGGTWESFALGFEYEGAFRFCPELEGAVGAHWEIDFYAPGEGAHLQKYGEISDVYMPVEQMNYSETRIEDGGILLCQKGESGGLTLTGYENGWLSMGVQAEENALDVARYDLFFRPKSYETGEAALGTQAAQTPAPVPPSAEELDWSGRWNLKALGADIDLGNGPEHYVFEPGIGIRAARLFFSPEGGVLLAMMQNSVDYYTVYTGNNCRMEGNVLRNTLTDITYLPETGELSFPLGAYALYFEKTAWPPELGKEAAITNAADYYGIWEQCAIYGDIMDYHGLIGGDLLAARMYFDFGEGVGRIVTSVRSESAINYIEYPVVDIQAEDGMLQLSYGANGENHAALTAYENGWISIKQDMNGIEYEMYFERNGFALDGYKAWLETSSDHGGTVAQQADPTAAPAKDSSAKVRINEGSNPNVRSKPASDGQKVGNAKSGKIYDLLEEKDGWFKIRLEDGSEGWIAGGMAQKVK